MCTAMKDSFVISIIWESLWKGHPLLASLSSRLPALNWTSKMWQYDRADQVLKFIIHVPSFSFVLMRSHLKLCDALPQLMKNSDPPACRIPMILEACSSLTCSKYYEIKTGIHIKLLQIHTRESSCQIAHHLKSHLECNIIGQTSCSWVLLYLSYLEFHKQPFGCFPYNPSRHLPESHNRTGCHHREGTTEAASLKNKTAFLSYASPCNSTTSLTWDLLQIGPQRFSVPLEI